MNKALERLVEIIREESEGEGLSFLAKETLKNNDTVLHAIHVIKDWSSVGIVVYVDDILKDYVTGAIGGRQAAKMFLERISKSGGDNCECENEAEQFAKAILQNKGTILENVHASIINTGWNTELLKNTPHKPFLDLAVIYEVHNHDHSMSVRVTNEMMEHFGISMSELEEYADRNKRAYVITDIEEVLPDAKETEFGMYILSTADHFKGASVLMYPEFFEKCAKFTGSDLVVIPSSIHEVIVVPYDEEVDINTITNMIQMVNATELLMMDRLSDHAYFYKARSNQVTMF